jgi:hypothetical protein
VISAACGDLEVGATIALAETDRRHLSCFGQLQPRSAKVTWVRCGFRVKPAMDSDVKPATVPG